MFIDGWMDKEDVVHTFFGRLLEYSSSIKKNEIMSLAATWMDLDTVILSEVRQRKTNIVWYHLYVESKKWYKWTYLQNRNRITDVENKLMVTKGEKGGGINWEIGIDIHTTIYKIGN